MKKYLLAVVVLAFTLFTHNNPLFAQNDGYYQNPVMSGDYPDPSILRDGNDYYMTHSSFEYYPGLIVWHSTDLINWEPVSQALKTYIGSVWAPDLIKHGETYYIYFPAGRSIWVITAKSPEGPWSEPINTGIHGFIDPGHLVDSKGNRYLYLSGGNTVKLKEDGLSADGAPIHNYDGWQFPKEWSTECFCLESPKSTIRNGYYYQTVAEGGTAGPATAHMVVSARSRTPYGPWENSPYNPIVHTDCRSERWWCQGHGTLVEDIAGQWWIVYHAYEKHFQTLGRQTLMLPIEWTDNDWFRVPDGVHSSDKIALPAGKKMKSNTSLSDDFSATELGMQWQFFKKYDPDRYVLRNGQLILQAEGSSFDNSSPLLVNAADRKYQFQVEYTIEGNATAGLCLFYNEQGNMRISANAKEFTVFNQKASKNRRKNEFGNHAFLRILNDENEVSFYYSRDGLSWEKLERTIDASGFNHNVFGGFMSLRAGIFAFGEGRVIFDNFIYKKL